MKTPIKGCSGKLIEVEGFTGTAGGSRFAGCRIRVGGEKVRRPVAALPARKIPELIQALQAVYDAARFEDDFYQSRAWLDMRYRILRRDGHRCSICGVQASDGHTLHVDHVKPRSRYPELSLDPSNLRVLCAACNLGKGAS